MHQSNLEISAAVCRAANGTIGLNGRIPWRGRVAGEQLIFKRHTIGKAVIMGRKTLYSLPAQYRPLPLRLNVMLTSADRPKEQRDIHICKSIPDALNFIEREEHYDEAVFIGGQRVYEEGLPYCETLYLTTLEAIFPGDAFFPKLDMSEWSVKEERYYPTKAGRDISFKFQILKRVK